LFISQQFVGRLRRSNKVMIWKELCSREMGIRGNSVGWTVLFLLPQWQRMWPEERILLKFELDMVVFAETLKSCKDIFFLQILVPRYRFICGIWVVSWTSSTDGSRGWSRWYPGFNQFNNVALWWVKGVRDRWPLVH
jgi:hypothetical protein